MPGHVKKTDGPDPCPDQWLIVSEELSIKLKSKPYDAKKSCWVPNKGTGGFDEGLIQSTSGDGAKTQITVKVLESGEVSLRTLDSGINVAPGISIAPGTFCKNSNRNP